MRLILLLLALLITHSAISQDTIEHVNPTLNVRLTLLLAPFTPLVTLELRTIGNLTLQGESNFVNTHGVNVKYFLDNRMEGNCLFTGIAFVENEVLREDLARTYLPYVGYGYAHRFGEKNQWVFDNRIGMGRTTNADTNSIYRVIKSGLGRIF